MAASAFILSLHPPAKSFFRLLLRHEMLTLSTGASCSITQGPLSWFTSRPAAPQPSLFFSPDPPPCPPCRLQTKCGVMFSELGLRHCWSPRPRKGTNAPLRTVAKWPLEHTCPESPTTTCTVKGTPAPEPGGARCHLAPPSFTNMSLRVCICQTGQLRPVSLARVRTSVTSALQSSPSRCFWSADVTVHLGTNAYPYARE